MISNFQDFTIAFNAGNGIVLDMSGWDNVVIDFATPSGTIDITATNDGGGPAGTTTGGPATATGFTTVQVTKLSDGTAVSTVAASGLFRSGVVGRYIKFAGASAAATSVIVMFYKIS